MGRYTENLTELASFRALTEFLELRRSAAPGDFEDFEAECCGLVRAFEAEVVADELARYDVDSQEIVVEGRTFRRVLINEPKRYLTSAGPIVVTRSLFRENGESKSICPLELRAGIIGGMATPRLGRQICFLMGHMTSTATAEAFVELRASGPSPSTCDRLPKVVSGAWEHQRELFESTLRTQETVPAEATVVAVSLDGVMVPDKDAQRKAKAERELAAQKPRRKKGKRIGQPGGPAGYREVGCGTVTLYTADPEGKPERLETIRYGREPEYKKATLTSQLDAELEAIVAVRSDLRLVALADGAEENWRYFDTPRWESATKIVDFGHASGHVKAGLAAYYGKSAVKCRSEYERLKVLLKDQVGGVDEILAELKRLDRKLPAKALEARKRALKDEVTYFENQRGRMEYAQYQALGLPIGSGIVEAACKTLATQRLKRSGMSWRNGKQPVLTIRSLQQSGRWSHGWSLVSATFKQPMSIVKRHDHLSLVVPLGQVA